jgi:hypothetical protein
MLEENKFNDLKLSLLSSTLTLFQNLGMLAFIELVMIYVVLQDLIEL